MTEDTNERTLGLSAAQVAGSALAAVTAAVLASFAGTAGTIIGAALGSVVATIGAAAYTVWLRRTSEAVRRTAVQVRQTSVLTGALPRKVTDGPLRPGKRLRRAEDEADGDSDGESGFSLRLLPWRKIALSTVAVLVTSLGGITAVEAVTGQPISALLGMNDSTGTTLGHVSGGDDNKQVPTEDENTEGPSPSPSPTNTTPTPTPTPDDEATPSQEADPADPDTTPALPTPTPSPSSDAGTEAPDGITGN